MKWPLAGVVTAAKKTPGWHRSLYADQVGAPLHLNGRGERIDVSSDIARAKIAVVAHVFYSDVWPQILESLNRIPMYFDIFVTVPVENYSSVGELVRRAFPQAQIYPTRNRGRDIAPFFDAVLRVQNIDTYTAICKIHTKKGIHEPDVWRYLLLKSVLGSDELIADIVRGFIETPTLGIVGARDLYFSGSKFLGPNRFNVERIVGAITGSLDFPLNWGFFAGTMFWIKPSLLDSLSKYVADALTFEENSTINDGKIEHALERVFGLLPLLAGHKIGLVETVARKSGSQAFCVYESGPQPNREEPLLYLSRKAEELRGKVFVPVS
jgi:lipopolysaccharide biosynthesis protein